MENNKEEEKKVNVTIQSNEDKFINKIMKVILDSFFKYNYVKIVNIKNLKTNENFLKIIPENSSISIFEEKHSVDIDFEILYKKLSILCSRIERCEYKKDLMKIDEIIAYS
jgi:hypothetical protein